MPFGRISTGLLVNDEFDRSDRDLRGDNNWGMSTAGTQTFDSGAWSIVSQDAVNQQTGNSRIHWGGGTALNTVIETAGQIEQDAINHWLGVVWNLRTDVLHTEFFLETRSSRTDAGYYGSGSRIATIANINTGALGTGETFTLKVASEHHPPDGNVLVWQWVNGTATALQGTAITNSVVGTADIGYAGLFPRNGTVSYHYFRAYKDTRLFAQDLDSGQYFVLFSAAGAAVGTSDVASGAGTTVLDYFKSATSAPHSGYVQVYSSGGNPQPGKRYPTVGSTSLWGGDRYGLTAGAEGTPNYHVEVNWEDTDTYPDMWAHQYGTLQPISIEIERSGGMPTAGLDTALVVVRDEPGLLIPGKTTSALYPYVDLGRRMRIYATFDTGGTYPLFYGRVVEYIVGMRAPFHTQLRAESPLRELYNIEVGVPPLANVYVYDPAATANSALSILLDALNLQTEVPPIPVAQRFLDTDMFLVEAWGGQTLGFGAWMEDLANKSGAMFWIEPNHRTSAAETDWAFYWQLPATKEAAPADITWSAEVGDADDIVPTFREDESQRVSLG